MLERTQNTSQINTANPAPINNATNHVGRFKERVALLYIRQSFSGNAPRWVDAFGSDNMVERLGIRGYQADKKSQYRERIASLVSQGVNLTKERIQSAVDQVNAQPAAVARNESLAMRNLRSHIQTDGRQNPDAFSQENLSQRLGIENYNPEYKDKYKLRILNETIRGKKPFTKASIQSAVDKVNQQNSPGWREPANPSDAGYNHAVLKDGYGGVYDYKDHIKPRPNWSRNIPEQTTTLNGKVKIYSRSSENADTLKETFDYYYENYPKFKKLVDEVIRRYGTYNIGVSRYSNRMRHVAGQSDGIPGNWMIINERMFNQGAFRPYFRNPDNNLGEVKNNVAHTLAHEMLHNLGYMHIRNPSGVPRWQFTNLTHDEYDDLTMRVFER